MKKTSRLGDWEKRGRGNSRLTAGCHQRIAQVDEGRDVRGAHVPPDGGLPGGKLGGVPMNFIQQAGRLGDDPMKSVQTVGSLGGVPRNFIRTTRRLRSGPMNFIGTTGRLGGVPRDFIRAVRRLRDVPMNLLGTFRKLRGVLMNFIRAGRRFRGAPMNLVRGVWELRGVPVNLVGAVRSLGTGPRNFIQPSRSVRIVPRRFRRGAGWEGKDGLGNGETGRRGEDEGPDGDGSRCFIVFLPQFFRPPETSGLHVFLFPRLPASPSSPPPHERLG